MTLAAGDSYSGGAVLPSTAPQVRVTVGEGTATQKSWNLRRPVTLIGSQRRAHIVLHDPNVSRVHCVIVNTGRDVLLKDLGSSAGTWCNDKRIDLAALNDGDVVAAGATRIRVSIGPCSSAPATGVPGPRSARPTMFPVPLFVRDLTIRSRWEVEKAVVLIGREAGEIQLDGTDVSPAHAILFSLNNGIAVSDVGGGTGLLVDGEAVTLAKVKPGQVVQIGSHRLEIGELTNLGLGSRSPTTPPIRTFASQSGPRAALKPALSRDQPDTDQPGSPLHDDNTKPADPITGSPADILSGLAALRQRVTESWDRLNTRNWSSNEDFLGLAASPAESTSRARELEEGDAALRGHLHDLTRLLEQLVEREREVTGHSKRIHEERLKLFRDKAAWAKRQVELDRQAAELARLELVLADRSAGNS